MSIKKELCSSEGEVLSLRLTETQDLKKPVWAMTTNEVQKGEDFSQ